jgi:hypothetical protein
MSEHDPQPPEPVSIEKRADLLQASFEHYYGMAMSHHAKAGTTSNILLVIVGAIIAFIGFDSQLCGIVDLGGAVTVVVVGLFGGLWALKQHERYHYWRHIALEYQAGLRTIVPHFETEAAYAPRARNAARQQFSFFFATLLRDRHLWFLLHGIVVLIGIGLVAALLVAPICH